MIVHRKHSDLGAQYSDIVLGPVVHVLGCVKQV